jgi:hypothetical protein
MLRMDLVCVWTESDEVFEISRKGFILDPHRLRVRFAWGRGKIETGRDRGRTGFMSYPHGVWTLVARGLDRAAWELRRVA